MRQVVGAASALVLLAAGCSFLTGGPLGEMTVSVKSGTLEIERGDEVIKVDDSESLEPGDILTTSTDGSARVRLRGDRSLLLSQRTSLSVLSGYVVETQSGSVLARTKGDAMQVRFGDVVASSHDGVFRVDKGVTSSARAGAYEGTVRVTAPGQPRVELKRLFQVGAAATELTRIEPYRIDYNDPWDNSILDKGAVVELDQNLEQLGSALSSQVGNERPGVDYFSALAGRDAGFVKPYVKRHRAADLVIGFMVAANVKKLSIGRAYERAFSLFGAGRQWGVVASILRSQPRQLVAELEDLVSATSAVAEGGTGDAFTVAAASAVADEVASSGSAIVPVASGDQGSGSDVDTGGDGGDPGSDDGGSGGDDPNDDGGGGDPDPDPDPEPTEGGGEEECEGTVVDCTVQDLTSPSPTPTGI